MIATHASTTIVLCLNNTPLLPRVCVAIWAGRRLPKRSSPSRNAFGYALPLGELAARTLRCPAIAMINYFVAPLSFYLLTRSCRADAALCLSISI